MAARNIVGAVLIAAALSACALPQSKVRSGTQRPSLAVIGAPPGATLRIDGIPMGEASQYDGRRQTLAVEEGLHLVEIQSGGSIIFQTKVYAAGGETSLVEVGGSNQ